jgi:hypothetical protein
MQRAAAASGCGPLLFEPIAQTMQNPELPTAVGIFRSHECDVQAIFVEVRLGSDIRRGDNSRRIAPVLGHETISCDRD